MSQLLVTFVLTASTLLANNTEPSADLASCLAGEATSCDAIVLGWQMGESDRAEAELAEKRLWELCNGEQSRCGCRDVGVRGGGIDRIEAIDIARRVLGPHVVRAIPYREPGGPQRIVADYWQGDLFIDRFAGLLERRGSEYVLLWKHGNYSEPSGEPSTDLMVVDADRNGSMEIVLSQLYGGSGGQYCTTSLYSPARGEVFWVEHNWDKCYETYTISTSTGSSANLEQPRNRAIRRWLEQNVTHIDDWGAGRAGLVRACDYVIPAVFQSPFLREGEWDPDGPGEPVMKSLAELARGSE